MVAKVSEEQEMKCPICYMWERSQAKELRPEKLMLMAYVVGVGNAVQEIMDKHNAFVAQIPTMCEPHRKTTTSTISGYVQSSMVNCSLNAAQAQELVKWLFGVFGVEATSEVLPPKESMQ